jgi:hypothetical protein
MVPISPFLLVPIISDPDLQQKSNHDAPLPRRFSAGSPVRARVGVVYYLLLLSPVFPDQLVV